MEGISLPCSFLAFDASISPVPSSLPDGVRSFSLHILGHYPLYKYLDRKPPSFTVISFIGADLYFIESGPSSEAPKDLSWVCNLVFLGFPCSSQLSPRPTFYMVLWRSSEPLTSNSALF